MSWTFKEFDKPKRFIDRIYRKPSKIAGYCHNQIHKGYLDKKLIEKHKCKKRQCQFFHEYK